MIRRSPNIYIKNNDNKMSMTVRDCHISQRLTKKMLSMVKTTITRKSMDFQTSKQIIEQHLFNLHA